MIKNYKEFLNESSQNNKIEESLLLTLAVAVPTIVLLKKLYTITNKKIKLKKAINGTNLDPAKRKLIMQEIQALSEDEVDIQEQIKRTREYEKSKLDKLDKKASKLSDSDKKKAEDLKNKLNDAKEKVKNAKKELSEVGSR